MSTIKSSQHLVNFGGSLKIFFAALGLLLLSLPLRAEDVVSREDAEGECT